MRQNLAAVQINLVLDYHVLAQHAHVLHPDPAADHAAKMEYIVKVVDISDLFVIVILWILVKMIPQLS